MTTRTARHLSTTASSSRRRRTVSAAIGAVVVVAAVAGLVVTGVLATSPGEIASSPVVVTHAVAATPADGATPAGSQTIEVTIPDLQAQVSEFGAAAPYGLRRAACHQLTGMDDESVEPLATCIAAIPSDAPRR